MKSHTDLEQSKRLSEILPNESADMYYEPSTGFCTEPSEAKFGDVKYAHPRSIRCWSLAALLAQMPCVELVSSQDNHYRAFWHEMYSEWHSNPVDACMELLNREHLAKNRNLINEEYGQRKDTNIHSPRVPKDG